MKRCDGADHRLTNRQLTLAKAVLQYHAVLANQPASRCTRLSLLEGRRHTFPLGLHRVYTEAPAFFTLVLIHQIGPPSHACICTETEISTPTATARPTQHERSSTAATARPTTFHLNFLETQRLRFTRLHRNLTIKEGLRRIMRRGLLSVLTSGWDRVAYNHKNGYDDFPSHIARTRSQTRFSRMSGITGCSTLQLQHLHYAL